MAVTPEGTSPLNPPNNPPQPNPRPGNPTPVMNPPIARPTPPVPPPPPARIPKSAKDKIMKMAKENNVTLINYFEPEIGNVTLTSQARDKNDIFDFMDAMERGLSLRDFENVKKGYKIQMDPDRQLITATLHIKYIPEY